MDYTASQAKAINSNSNKILVVAGAGSGKTRTLVERVCRLVSEGVDPRRILALTFSNKAATEMKNRIVKKLGVKASKIWVKTFHSFGLNIIRMYGEQVGISVNFDIIDSSAKNAFVKEYLNKNKLGFLPVETFSMISSIKNQTLECPENFNNLYNDYDNYLKENKLIDFDDMVSISIDIFNKSEEIKSHIQDRFLHVLVDEYQDTNFIQNKLIKALAGDNNLFFVGDDDQCIYEWRGSKPGYFRELNNSGDYEVIHLNENFRSEKSIISIANVIISKNTNRIPKEMIPTINSKNNPIIKTFLNNTQEALFIVKEIKSAIGRGYKKNEIAVLGRNIAQLDKIKYFLDEEKIEYRTIIDVSNHEYGFIRFLRNIRSLEYKFNFSAAINFPDRILDNFTFEDIKEKNIIESQEVFDIICEIYDKNIQFDNVNKFRKRFDLIMKYNKEEFSPIELVYEYSKLIKGIDKNDPSDLLKSYVTELRDIKLLTETFVFENDKTSLTEYIDYLQCMLVHSDENIMTNTDGVNILTCHRSKGLEYDFVFIPGLQIGNFPNDYFVTTQEEVEQERRLLYVALTRARKQLYITRFDKKPSIYPFQFSKEGFFSELESIKYDLNNEILEVIDEKEIVTEFDKDKMYKKVVNTLTTLQYLDIPNYKRNRYSGRNDIIKLKNHPDVLEYIVYGEYLWTKNKTNTILPDYTPQLTYYIKSIEKLLIELIDGFSKRKLLLGYRCKIKDAHNNLINLETNSWKNNITFGNMLSFIKKNANDIISNDDKQFVLDYLYNYKNDVRNDLFHTGEIKSREDANTIRIKTLCLTKMILADLY